MAQEVRNRIISLAVWTIANGWYPVSLAAWVIRQYKPPKSEYRLLMWLHGQRIAKCRECGFKIRWSWNFCPNCGGDVQKTLLLEID